MSAKYSLEPAKFLEVVKATIFQRGASNEELIAFLTVANRYNLDPFRREIYAFPQDGKIVPVVGVDGWARIANDNPAYDGCEFTFEHSDAGALVSVEARIYRKDRSHPVCVREYLDECKRNTPPWNNMKHRMLRHRGFIQGIRLALGVSGIMDEDEYEQWMEQNRSNGPARPRTLADLTTQIRSVPGAAEPPADSSSASAADPSLVSPTPPSPPQAPAVEILAPIGERLYDLIAEVREFEEWALESENIAAWNGILALVGIQDTRNLKALGTAKVKPLVDAIRAWRHAQHAVETAPVVEPTSTAPSRVPVAEHQPPPGPPSPNFHAEVWALRSGVPDEQFNAVVRKYNGRQGIMNYGLQTDQQQALLADLRALATATGG
jgi:hypothetical protein